MLLAFDAPTREECTAQRPISNTPTAALVLLNDPSFVEAARALAARDPGERRQPTTTSGFDWAWRQVLGRDADDAEEVEVLATLLDKHRKHYGDSAEAADALLTVGISTAAEERRRRRTGGLDLGQPRAVEFERDDYTELTTTIELCESQACMNFKHVNPSNNSSTAARSWAGRRWASAPSALASLLQPQRVRPPRRLRRQAVDPAAASRGVVNPLHFAPKAKRVIFLYMAGGPSHLETFDDKPKLAEMHGQPMPESFTKGQPIAQLQGQKLQVPAARSTTFSKHGQSGQEISELFPHIGSDRRRHLHRPLDADRADQSRPGPHVHEHRHDDLRPAEHGLVGHLRPGQRERQTCRASSC